MIWADKEQAKALKKFLKTAKGVDFAQRMLLLSINKNIQAGKHLQELDDGELGITRDINKLLNDIKHYKEELIKINQKYFGDENE